MKIVIFHTPSAFDAPIGGPRPNTAKRFGVEN